MIVLEDNLTFKDIQNNIEAIKTKYQGILSLFCCKNLKKDNETIHNIKLEIFNYKGILYWQRERLWEAMNGDFDINEFKMIGG